MARNEKTSKRVAAIAAKILRQVPKKGIITVTFKHPQYGLMFVEFDKLSWADIRSLAASVLTQTPDKKK